MKSQDPILERWQTIVRHKANAPAILASDGTTQRTFTDIEIEATEALSNLEQLPVGSVVAVQIGNHPAWPALLLAALRRGLVTLPLETTIRANERATALELCRAGALISANPTAGDASHASHLKLETFEQVAFPEDPPALLKLTSGTTAAPRAIRFRSSQLLADCDQICETMEITDHDLNFGVIPVSHSYGFSNLITPLIARGVPMVLSRDRLPRAVLDGLGRTAATVFPGMPVFYQAFCGMTAELSLEHLRLCISAGAPLPAAVACKFSERFERQIHSFYGSSECGGICYDREGNVFEDGYVGTPMKGVELEVLGSGAEATRVTVRSAAVADSYWPEADSAKLGAGIFNPDDLLATHGDGFKVAGRLSDLINVAGKKVNPAEVEAQLLAAPGVREAVVFGRQSALRNEEVAACVVADDSVGEADLLRLCRERLSGWQVPKRIFLVPKIPVNERGKTSRRELAARFARE